jgi:hypothetical protein
MHTRVLIGLGAVLLVLAAAVALTPFPGDASDAHCPRMTYASPGASFICLAPRPAPIHHFGWAAVVAVLGVVSLAAGLAQRRRKQLEPREELATHAPIEDAVPARFAGAAAPRDARGLMRGLMRRLGAVEPEFDEDERRAVNRTR